MNVCLLAGQVTPLCGDVITWEDTALCWVTGGDGCCSLAILQGGEVAAMIGGLWSMIGGP